MFLDTVDQFATIAAGKAAFLRRSPLGFWISSMIAGAYVGLGIILIFCVGATVDPSIRLVVMGASSGIALTLVIFAGSIIYVAAAKMNAPAVELVARAMLCNWLVCLAIWTSARMTKRYRQMHHRDLLVSPRLHRQRL